MNKLYALMGTLGILMMPTIAQAQDVVPPEGFDLVGTLIEAAQGGHWSLFVSAIIMLLVWLATKAPLLKDVIKGKSRIWTAAVAGVLGAFATSIFVGHVSGDINWLTAIVDGLSVGLAAGGLWSLVGRKIMGQPIDANNDGVLDPLGEDSEEDTSTEDSTEG